MDFDALQHATAKQQIKLLGGVVVALEKKAGRVDPTWALIERDLAVQSDNGLSIENRTVISLLVREVGRVERGDRVITATETFTLADVMANDGFIVRVFVRG